MKSATTTGKRVKAKERTIKEVIKKVAVWRRLYTGRVSGETLVRYTLEDAARKV